MSKPPVRRGTLKTVLTLLGISCVAAATMGAFVAGIFYFIYRMVAADESFQVVVRAVRESPELSAKVGDIQEIRPCYFGPFSLRTSGDEGTLQVRALVAGSRDRLAVQAHATKRGGEWSMTELVDRGSVREGAQC